MIYSVPDTIQAIDYTALTLRIGRTVRLGAKAYRFVGILQLASYSKIQIVELQK